MVRWYSHRSRWRQALLDAKRRRQCQSRSHLECQYRNPNGESSANRTDIEVLFDKLPEPIDLDLDLSRRMVYWTDRGNAPRGNTVSRARLDARDSNGQEILVNDLMEGIGLALDLEHERMFFSDLAGSVYSAKLNGSEKRALLLAQGNLTGVAYAELAQDKTAA